MTAEAQEHDPAPERERPDLAELSREMVRLYKELFYLAPQPGADAETGRPGGTPRS